MFKVWNNERKTFLDYAVSQPFELSGLVVVMVGSEPKMHVYLCKLEEQREVAFLLERLSKVVINP